MSHIFVSHATADDGIVSKLHDELEAATGLNMWVDHKDLKPPEDNFRAALHEALKDCGAGLLVLSKNTIGRDEIVAEWNYVLSLERPLYVAKVDDIAILDINPRLLIVQWVDLQANWEAGVRTLAAYMRGESAPADAPLVQPRKISGIDDRKLLNIPMSGREAELKETLDKLKREPVMIVGVGGRGKSRLAAETAIRSTDTKGAVWHRVDDISSAEDVINGLREHFEMANDAPRKDVLGKLRQEKTLVIIDNAESAEEDSRRADYCKLVETLMRAGAQVLLTGRAEWTEIEPLGVVRPEPIKETATAVQILLDMGKVFETPYDLTGEAEALATAALMHPRLMEWAVKQTKREAPKDVLKELQGLKSRDVQKALDEMIHKTLRQMTAAGDDRAEKLLRQLVVFRGAFTIEAVEAVTGFDEDDLREARNQLQEWQFVTMQADGNEARYRVDRLALEVLTASEEARAAHFAYYNSLHGDHNANNNYERHPLIERDWENLRAALAWGFEHEAEAACDMATALHAYMKFRLSYESWRETLSKAQEAAVTAGYAAGEAITLRYLGQLDQLENHYADARANFTQALKILRHNANLLGEAHTLKALGDLDIREAQYGKARANYSAALLAFRQIPSRLGEANTLKALGDLDQAEAQYAKARENYSAALLAFRQIPSRLGEAQTLQALGDLDRREAQYAKARENYSAALLAFRQIPDRLGEANTLKALGNLDLREAQYGKARANYEAALLAYRQIPDRLGEANSLQALGDLEVREDQYGKARVNYEAALLAFRQIPDRLGEANTLQALGDLDRREALYGKARANYEAALLAFRQIPSRLGEANTLRALGDLDQAESHWESAYVLYRQAITLFQSLPDLYSEAVTQRRMWPTLAALGQHEEAIKGILFARDVYIRIGLTNYLNLVHGSMKSLREQIGEEAFMTAWKAVMGDAPLPEWLE